MTWRRRCLVANDDLFPSFLLTQTCLDFNYEDFVRREDKLLVKIREFMERCVAFGRGSTSAPAAVVGPVAAPGPAQIPLGLSLKALWPPKSVARIIIIPILPLLSV